MLLRNRRILEWNQFLKSEAKHPLRKDSHFGKLVAFVSQYWWSQEHLCVHSCPPVTCFVPWPAASPSLCCTLGASSAHKQPPAHRPPQAWSQAGGYPSSSRCLNSWNFPLKNASFFLYLSVFSLSHVWCGFTGWLYSAICNTSFKGQQPLHVDRPEGPRLLHKLSLKTNKSWAAWIFYGGLPFIFPYWLDFLCGKAFLLA